MFFFSICSELHVLQRRQYLPLCPRYKIYPSTWKYHCVRSWRQVTTVILGKWYCWYCFGIAWIIDLQLAVFSSQPSRQERKERTNWADGKVLWLVSYYFSCIVRPNCINRCSLVLSSFLFINRESREVGRAAAYPISCTVELLWNWS